MKQNESEKNEFLQRICMHRMNNIHTRKNPFNHVEKRIDMLQLRSIVRYKALGTMKQKVKLKLMLRFSVRLAAFFLIPGFIFSMTEDERLSIELIYFTRIDLFSSCPFRFAATMAH